MCDRNNWPLYPALPFVSPSFLCYRLDVFFTGGIRYLVHAVFPGSFPAEAGKKTPDWVPCSMALGLLQKGEATCHPFVMACSGCYACLCSRIGRACQALVLGVLSPVTRLITSHEPVCWLCCKSWWTCRSLVHFPCVAGGGASDDLLVPRALVL